MYNNDPFSSDAQRRQDEMNRRHQEQWQNGWNQSNQYWNDNLKPDFGNGGKAPWQK